MNECEPEKIRSLTPSATMQVKQDTVPQATTVLSAAASMAPAPTANEQMVEWAGAVGSGETVTITAVFTGQETFEETAELFVYTARVYWPVIFKQ